MIARLKAQSVYVEDQQKAKQFYVEKLGFVVRKEEALAPGAVWLEVAPPDGEACLVLFPKKLMPSWASLKPSVIFYCENTVKTFETLKARGVEFTDEPEKMAVGTFAQFRDIDGNEFVLSDVG